MRGLADKARTWWPAALYSAGAVGVVIFVFASVVDVFNTNVMRAIDTSRQAEMLSREATECRFYALASSDSAEIGTCRIRLTSRIETMASALEAAAAVDPMAANARLALRRLQPGITAIPASDSAAAVAALDEIRAFASDVHLDMAEMVTAQTERMRAYAGWTAALSAAIAIAGLVMLAQFITLRAKNAELERLATRDPLTGLLNRRSANERGAMLATLARRSGFPLSVVVLDLDHFKQINDTWGHPTGDAVLQRAAALLTSMMRQGDVIARVGGEEMCAILPDTDAEGAAVICERMRATLADSPVVHGGHTINFTASLGVATGWGDAADFDALYHRADAALYLSKQAGRNRVTAANHTRQPARAE